MNPEDSTPPQYADYTAIAVQLGVLQEGQRNTLNGIEEIKSILSDHSEDIGSLKSKVAVLESNVAAHEDQLKQSRPQKGMVWTIISSVTTAAVLIFFILDRFYLPVAH